jgi:hypothetical protein
MARQNKILTVLATMNPSARPQEPLLRRRLLPVVEPANLYRAQFQAIIEWQTRPSQNRHDADFVVSMLELGYQS